MRDSIRARGETGRARRCSTGSPRGSPTCRATSATPPPTSGCAEAIGGARTPVFYLETPPSLFATVVGGLAAAGLTGNARVVIEKPFGHDLASARALAAAASPLAARAADLPCRPLPRQARARGAPLPPLREHDARARSGTASHVASVQITMAEAFGVEDRGRFYDAVGALRDVVVNHLLQLLAAATMERAARGRDARRRAPHGFCEAVADADPSRYVRGQYAGYRATPGVAPRSTTETYAALELRIENERWRGVPVPDSHRQAPPGHPDRGPADLPRRRRPLEFLATRQAAERERARRSGSTRAPGIRMILEAHRADAAGPASRSRSTWSSPTRAARARPRTRSCSRPPWPATTRFFTSQKTVEQAWRIVQPLLEADVPVHRYRPGSWGPAAADGLLGEGRRWRVPWRSVIPAASDAG